MGQNGTGQSHRQYGAADSVRHETGIVRFKVYDEGYPASVDAMRDALGDNGFDSAWAEGTALSTLEAIAYARRGHSDRERPTSGWDALTPTEHDVVRLVTEGLANKDIATGSSSRRAPCREPPHTRLQQARDQLAGTTRARGRPTQLASCTDVMHRAVRAPVTSITRSPGVDPRSTKPDDRRLSYAAGRVRAASCLGPTSPASVAPQGVRGRR